MTGRMLTYAQAAEVLNVSPKTIARRVKCGALAVLIDGGIRRIPADTLAQFVADRTLPPVTSRSGRAPGVANPRPSRRGSGSAGPVRRLWEDAEPNPP